MEQYLWKRLIAHGFFCATKITTFIWRKRSTVPCFVSLVYCLVAKFIRCILTGQEPWKHLHSLLSRWGDCYDFKSGLRATSWKCHCKFPFIYFFFFFFLFYKGHVFIFFNSFLSPLEKWRDGKIFLQFRFPPNREVNIFRQSLVRTLNSTLHEDFFKIKGFSVQNGGQCRTSWYVKILKIFFVEGDVPRGISIDQGSQTFTS